MEMECPRSYYKLAMCGLEVLKEVANGAKFFSFPDNTLHTKIARWETDLTEDEFSGTDFLCRFSSEPCPPPFILWTPEFHVSWSVQRRSFQKLGVATHMLSSSCLPQKETLSFCLRISFILSTNKDPGQTWVRRVNTTMAISIPYPHEFKAASQLILALDSLSRGFSWWGIWISDGSAVKF